MGLKVGEIGKIINVNTDFDLTGNTDVQLKFTKADASILTVDKAGGVSVPAVPFTDPDTGDIYAAGEYLQYAFQSGDLSVAGQWYVSGRYIDATPKDFCGDSAAFTVLPC